MASDGGAPATSARTDDNDHDAASAADVEEEAAEATEAAAEAAGVDADAAVTAAAVASR